MNTREQLIKARLGLLQLAEELDNVKLACKRAGISRSHFYEIKEAFERFGRNGLAPQPKRRPRMPNQTPPEVEQQILDMSAHYPTFSYVRISGQLKLAGFGISPSTVRAVWQRNGLLHRSDRLLWLERRSLEQGGPVLTDNQIRLLRLHRGRTQDPEEHIESSHPGYLLCQDTYFVGVIKGVGKIYMQSVVDAFCSHAWGKLYLSKTPITAADVLNDRVLPFFEEHDVPVLHALTDNGREYCGRELQHAYELYLAINQIRHRRTGVRSPETNGFCERFHRTVKEEFFSVAFRQKLYGSVAELQVDLDRWLELYNTQRPHQGYRTKGRTPYQAFLDGLDLMRQETAA